MCHLRQIKRCQKKNILEVKIFVATDESWQRQVGWSPPGKGNIVNQGESRGASGHLWGDSERGVANCHWHQHLKIGSRE